MKRTTQDGAPGKTATLEQVTVNEKSAASSKSVAAPTTAKNGDAAGNGKNNGAQPNGQVGSGELAAILASLQTMRDGDFSVRLPGAWTGLAGQDRRHLQRNCHRQSTNGERIKARRTSSGKRGKDTGAHAVPSVERRVGRDGSVRQYPGGRLAAADGGSYARDCGRGARKSYPNGAVGRGRAAAGRRVPAVRDDREHHDSTIGRVHRGSDARGARSGHRWKIGRAGAGARRGGNVEGS